MKLIIMNDTYEFANNNNGVDEAIQKINESIEESGLIFSHLIVNNTDVFADHADYILEKINEVDEIKVILKSELDMVLESIFSAEQYLTNALPEVNTLVNEFYQNPTEDSWNKLLQLLDGVQWLIQMIDSIDQLDHSLEEWDQFITAKAKIGNELQALAEGLENKDAVLIADVIQYEIFPILEALKQAATKTIDNQGSREILS